MDKSVAVQQFLAVNAGAFCDECLCAPLGVHPDELKAAIFAESRVFARTMARCSRCRRSRPVTSLRRAA